MHRTTLIALLLSGAALALAPQPPRDRPPITGERSGVEAPDRSPVGLYPRIPSAPGREVPGLWTLGPTSRAAAVVGREPMPSEFLPARGALFVDPWEMGRLEGVVTFGERTLRFEGGALGGAPAHGTVTGTMRASLDGESRDWGMVVERVPEGLRLTPPATGDSPVAQEFETPSYELLVQPPR